MSGYLLDTNVVSELVKRRPHPAVVNFLSAQDDLWLSAIVVEELELGVRLLPEGRCRDGLKDWLSKLMEDFDQHVLPVETPEAVWAATLQARAHRDGRVLELADALIAGTAVTHNLAVATRNVADFDGLEVGVTNPWEQSGVN